MPVISRAEVLERLSYEPETGIFHWLVCPNNRVPVGSVAGFKHRTGYWFIKIDRKEYPTHRLAWLVVHGLWPRYEIDHIDGNPSNNAIANLRDVPHRTNVENRRTANSRSKSGFLGVRQEGSRFVAYIGSHGRQYQIGSFSTPEEAHAAYVDVKRQLHVGCTL
jgi:hypothetical protein